jgi:ABC-type branched-subunit amino acid transport system substrate-binding protein
MPILFVKRTSEFWHIKGKEEAMKKFLWIPLAVILIAGLIFSGCAKPAEEVPSEIRIGIPMSITGMFGGFGEGSYGSQAAIDDINALGGVYIEEYGERIPMRGIVVDYESDPVKVGTLSEDLVLRDDVQFLVSHLGPPPVCSPIAMVSQRYKVPYLGGGGPMEPWLGLRDSADEPWEYAWTPGIAIGTPAAPGSYWDKPGYTVNGAWFDFMDVYGPQTNMIAAMFATDEPDGRGWYEAMPPALEAAGYTVVGVEEELGMFPMGTTDFTSIIQEWMNNDCEVLWGNVPAPDFGALWRQCWTQGFQPKIVMVGRAPLYYVDVVAWGGDLPQGIGVERWWDSNWQDSPGIGGTTPRSLVDRWVEDTGDPMNPMIGPCYAMVQIIYDALERAGTLEVEAVNRALGETNTQTILHHVEWDENHYCRIPLYVGQWQKTDEPWVWECPAIYSRHDFIPVTADPIFPMIYD